MRIIINNYGKSEEKQWPRLMACFHCKSVLRVELEDVLTTVTGRAWNKITDKRFTCAACGQQTVFAHNTFHPEDELETF